MRKIQIIIGCSLASLMFACGGGQNADSSEDSADTSAVEQVVQEMEDMGTGIEQAADSIEAEVDSLVQDLN